MDYGQLLFSELRLLAVPMQTAPLTEANLVKALTVNEELLALGYVLSGGDIVRLAQSAAADTLAARVREYAGDVKAKPMYPDFPSQVMDADEAVLRFHQLLHYYSTYGVEQVSGMPVTRGWLPEMQDTEKTEPDDTLLEAKLLALIAPEEQYLLPARKILGKTERMTDKECSIIAECARALSPETLAGLKVTFKQNLLLLFRAIFVSEALSPAQKLDALQALCQHTGDVWKCMDYVLTHAGYHFRTSQKRLLVKLLERYPEQDFRENLILSGKKRERTLLMLKYIDFNTYSRNPACRAAVAALRAGTLRSWESAVKARVAAGDTDVLSEYAKRPGMMLRHLTYLLRNGYSPAEMQSQLLAHAAELNAQTLVHLIGFFSHALQPSAGSSEERQLEAGILRELLLPVLERRLAANETPLRGRKVYIHTPDFNLHRSELRTTDKSEEGGYIRSGLAYRIPEEAHAIRFFVYWNDPERVDIDLHAMALEQSGREINIGWDARFKDNALVFSGDITHSDAAEYIDIDLDKAARSLRSISLNIHIYYGKPSFGEIAECFVGVMAVAKTGTEIKLYNPANCFYTHYLTGSSAALNYGYVDIDSRLVVFDGVPAGKDYYSAAPRMEGFSVSDYLEILLRAQGAEEAYRMEDADYVLVMGKPASERELSLIDNNFFLED